MNDRIENKIRELFEELDQAAPQPPPTPRVPERRPAPRWQRMLVPLGTTAVFLLVLGVASQLLFGGASEDAGDDATGTTSAQAEPATTGAAEGGDTGDGGQGPTETRPPGFALVLADLNLACSAFVETSASAVPSPPETDGDYVNALAALVVPLETLQSSIDDAQAELGDPSFAPIAEEVSTLLDSVVAAAAGPVAGARSEYEQTRLDLEGLGDDLTVYGALECSELAGEIP